MPIPTSFYSTRRATALLALLYLCFVVYGSLVPLKYVAMPVDKAVAAFGNIPFLSLGIDSRADWVANLLLFVPLSFLCMHSAVQGRTGPVRYAAAFAVLLASVGLAFAIEFSQLFFPQRTVSQNDIWAESLGSVVGIVSQVSFGSTFNEWLAALGRGESRQTRFMRALSVYLAVLLVFSILPLDLTISPVELYHKWSAGRVVLFPFAGAKGNPAQILYETLTDIAIWIPVGWLWSLDGTRQRWRVVALGVLAATLIEAAQLLVYSRVTDVTDILLAAVGTLVGTASAHWRRVPVSQGRPSAALLLAAWWLWVGVMLAVFWFPYNFDLTRVTLSSAIAELHRPLLSNYYFGTEYHATNELLRKLGLFLPGGVLWVGWLHCDASINRGRQVIGGVLFAVIALVIEAGQLGLPGKYADLADVLIMTSGGILGMLVTQWVLSGREASVPAVAEPAIGTSRLPVRRRGNRIGRLSELRAYLIAFAVLALTIGVAARLPFVPYNVRELIAPGALGLVSVTGLSLCILWQVAGHAMFLRWCARRYGQMIFLPLWLLVHGGISWALLRVSVPMESLHDIVGAPVLNWRWETELIARFVLLDAAVAIQILGAAIIVSVATRRGRSEDLFGWLAWTLILAWPLHWVVVTRAATDNLTELMRNGGSFASSILLASGLLAFSLAGSLASRQVALRMRAVPTALAIIALLAGSATCLWFGTEQVIVKYGKIFSAWQFLLSSDRAHYVSGAALLVRIAVAYGIAFVTFSAIHVLLWKTKDSDA